MVMTITLVIFAILFLMFVMTTYSIQTVRNSIDISVYFKLGLAENTILQIKQQVEADPRVAQVTYTSADQAWEQFKQMNAGNQTITNSVGELTDNPLPATLHVKAKNLGDYPAIVQSLQTDQYKDSISNVNYQNDPRIQTAIDRLNKILKFTVTGGISLIVIFSLIAILVIFNTITLTIHNRREEVEIMRLVGATNWYIRGPFVVESFLYSLFSLLFTGILLSLAFAKLLPPIIHFINPELALLQNGLINYWYVLLMLTVVSLILSVGSTLMAMRRYLRI